MIVKGWSNGSANNATGSGYGIRVDHLDRERHFKESWESAWIELDNGDIFEVNLSDSFRTGCIELRSSRIGSWMLRADLAPWPKGKPPKMLLDHIKGRTFRLKRV